MSALLVCYDIGDDRLRRRIARRLRDQGARTQLSAFWCEEREGAGLLRWLRTLPLGDSDSVRVYRPCARCLAQVAGEVPAVRPPKQAWIV